MKVDILLVEDDPNDAELIQRALRRNNVTGNIAVLEDGEEALEYIFGTGRHADRTAGIPARIVLLDIKLPIVDGIEVLRRIKGDPRTRRTPVVMLTSSRQDADLQRAYDLGANSYVVKPVDIGELTNAVRDCGAYWLRVSEAPPG